jgi:phospholipid-binding lipoprotein MlaA
LGACTTRGASSLLLALLCAVSAAPATAQEGVSGQTPPAVEEQTPRGENPLALEGAPDPLYDEDWGEAEAAPNDPLEPGNRAVLAFNRRVDAILWEPFTIGYRFVMPEPGRRSVRRIFTNLYTPVYLLNHLLQTRFVDAAETLGAFVMNSTFGLLGVFDAGGAVNLQARPADFGQTLGFYGVGAGPYLMIPVFGPTTVRDGVGGVVDFFMHPLTYFLGAPILAVGYGSAGVARREEVADQLEALQDSSVDYYSVLRSAYLQAREQSIAECRRRSGNDAVAMAPGGASAKPELEVAPF